MANRLRFLNPKKTLFLLCDIQDKFRPGMPLFDNMVQNANKLTKAGKALEVPLIVTEHYPEKLGNTVAGIDVSHAQTIVAKTRFSMMVPELENKVQELFGKESFDVVLFGLEVHIRGLQLAQKKSHICIEQTALELLERNINVFLVADCCCSRLNQDRDLALDRLRAAGCVVTTSESVIFNLLRDKNHPKFDEVRKFVSHPSVDMELSKSGGGSKL